MIKATGALALGVLLVACGDEGIPLEESVSSRFDGVTATSTVTPLEISTVLLRDGKALADMRWDLEAQTGSASVGTVAHALRLDNEEASGQRANELLHRLWKHSTGLVPPAKAAPSPDLATVSSASACWETGMWSGTCIDWGICCAFDSSIHCAWVFLCP